MKQKKGKDYKSTRQWTDEDRLAKKRLGENIEISEKKGEFGEDKPVLPEKKDGNEEWRGE